MFGKEKKTPWYASQNGQINPDGTISVEKMKFESDIPYFFDLEHVEWVKELEQNFPIIQKEIDELLAKDDSGMETFFQGYMVRGSWKLQYFYFFLVPYFKNIRKCPNLVKVLKKIPDCTSACLSLMGPNTTIIPHNGDTDAFFRYHFGLNIPDQLPSCGFEVEGEQRSWEEGKVLGFCDAYRHTAWNKTDKPRLILIIDTINPEFANQKRSLCFKICMYLCLISIKNRFPILGKLQLFILKMIYWFKHFRTA